MTFACENDYILYFLHNNCVWVYCSNLGVGHETYIDELKSHKVKSGTCHMLPNRELGWLEMQADTKNLKKKRIHPKTDS